MAGMVHLLVQNTHNQNIRLTDGIKDGMPLKFNAKYFREQLTVTPHVRYSGQRFKKRLESICIAICLSLTKIQEGIIINSGEIIYCSFS